MISNLYYTRVFFTHAMPYHLCTLRRIYLPFVNLRQKWKNWILSFLNATFTYHLWTLRRKWKNWIHSFLNVTFSWTFSQAAIVAFFSSLGELGLYSALLVLHSSYTIATKCSSTLSFSIKHSFLSPAVLFEGRIPLG